MKYQKSVSIRFIENIFCRCIVRFFKLSLYVFAPISAFKSFKNYLALCNSNEYVLEERGLRSACDPRSLQKASRGLGFVNLKYICEENAKHRVYSIYSLDCSARSQKKNKQQKRGWDVLDVYRNIKTTDTTAKAHYRNVARKDIRRKHLIDLSSRSLRFVGGKNDVILRNNVQASDKLSVKGYKYMQDQNLKDKLQPSLASEKNFSVYEAHDDNEKFKMFLSYYCIDKHQSISIDFFNSPLIVVISDISDSTLLWNLSPLLMSNAITRHDIITKNLIKKYNGLECRNEGDSFLVVFTDEREAVNFSIDLNKKISDVYFDLIRGIKFDVKIAVNKGDVSLTFSSRYNVHGVAVDETYQMLSHTKRNKICLKNVKVTDGAGDRFCLHQCK